MKHQLTSIIGIIPRFYILGQHIALSSKNRFLNLSSVLTCTFKREFLKLPGVPDDFKDYDLHRKLMTDVKCPEVFNFCTDVFDQWAVPGNRQSASPALWCKDDSGQEVKLSFDYLKKMSDRAANMLTELCGLKRNDKMIVILPRIPEWWILNLASIRTGIVLSPGTILLRPKDIKHRIIASEAKLIVADANGLNNVDMATKDMKISPRRIFVGSQSETRQGWQNFYTLMEAADEIFQNVLTHGDDPMTLFFTSGTTGAPKMALHTHGSYGYGHAITARYFLDIDQYGMIWNMSDTGWAKAAYSSLFAPWFMGACVFVYNTEKFDPKMTLQILQDYPLTHLCAPPTVFRHLVKESLRNYKLANNLRCLGAGEPVNPELLKEWKEGTGLTLYEGYGQSETTILCGTHPCMTIRPGSMGKATPGVDLQVVDNDGNILPRNTEGIIGVRVKPIRPIGLFSYYVGDEKRNKAVFKGDFYLTGDRAKLDEDGYFWFIGRDDDVMLSSGYRIGPFEVESALIEHPAVLESAVVSSPDEFRGEVVKAFVILTKGYVNHDKDSLVEELQNYVKSVTAPYKYPRKIEFVDELPKTVSGKIRRVELRNKEWKRTEEQ